MAFMRAPGLSGALGYRQENLGNGGAGPLYCNYYGKAQTPGRLEERAWPAGHLEIFSFNTLALN